MGFWDIRPLDEIPDLQLVPEGEYQVRCVEVEVKKKKEDLSHEYLNLRLEIEGQPVAQDVYCVLSRPHPDDGAKGMEGKERRIKAACEAFGVTDFNPNAFIGCVAWALIKVDQRDPQYPEKNVISNWVKRA